MKLGLLYSALPALTTTDHDLVLRGLECLLRGHELTPLHAGGYGRFPAGKKQDAYLASGDETGLLEFAGEGNRVLRMPEMLGGLFGEEVSASLFAPALFAEFDDALADVRFGSIDQRA